MESSAEVVESVSSGEELQLEEPFTGLPPEDFEGIKYYGDVSKCKMSKEMSAAYANAVSYEIENAKSADSDADIHVHALLMDLADDGMPLLLTVTLYDREYGNVYYYSDRENLGVWTWNGSEAQKYDFNADGSQGYIFGYSFYPKNNEYMISVGDGLAIEAGECSGGMSYLVSDAQIKLVNRSMHYSAYIDENNLVHGRELRGVESAQSHDGFYTASIEDVLNSGWIATQKENGDYEYFMADYVNDKMVKYADYDEYIKDSEEHITEKDEYVVYNASNSADYVDRRKWSLGEDVISVLNSYAK